MNKEDTKQAILGFTEFFKGITGNQDLKIPNDIAKKYRIETTLAQEPCEDAISRQAVSDTIFAECSGTKLDIDFAKVLILQRAIKALPSVTSQPKMGYWTPGSGLCSCCGKDKFKNFDADIWTDWYPKFCPNCGAKMEIKNNG